MVFVIAGIQLTIGPVSPAIRAQRIEQEIEKRRFDQMIDENRYRVLRDSIRYGFGKIY